MEINDFSLEGKNVLVTGASSGIGKVTARIVSEYGARVIISGRDEERLDATYRELAGNGHEKIKADFLKDEDIDSLVNQLPSLDGAVFCAGVTNHLPLKFIRQKDMNEIFRINYSATVLIVNGLMQKKKLNKEASLVFMSSISLQYPYFGGTLYNSTKAALEAFSKVLALEGATSGIRSNCLGPSFVETKMLEDTKKTVSLETISELKARHPLGFGTPRDVALACVFYLSAASRWITATNLVLGGFIETRNNG